MEANDYQIDGWHYKDMSYQPWDFICDLELSFVIGSIIKYVSRHRAKNGVRDLRKALHFINKAIERGLTTHKMKHPRRQVRRDLMAKQYTNQLHPDDAKVVNMILYNQFHSATNVLNDMIARAS